MPSRARAMGALALFVSACGIERLDAGAVKDHAPELPDGAVPVSEPPLWPYGAPSNSFNQPCTLPAPPELAGTWQGQFDSQKFHSGSSAIRIDVKGSFMQSDGLCGTVTFGEGTAPPVATDPKALPPGEPPNPAPGFATSPLEGFPYEFYQNGKRHVPNFVSNDGGPLRAVDAGFPDLPGAVEGNQVRFGVTLRQPLKSWCNLQLSYEVTGSGSAAQALLRGGSTTSCIPASAAETPDGTDCGGVLSGVLFRDVSCAQAEYCVLHACDCNSWSYENMSPPHGCTVSPTNETAFILTVDGSTLSGTVTLSGYQTVHLTRMP